MSCFPTALIFVLQSRRFKLSLAGWNELKEHVMTTLSGRNALVTGGGSGIGRAVALDLAAAGAAESALLFVTSLVILILFSPSKKRPVALLPTLWAATSRIRFVAALGASILLYYGAQFELRALLFSFLLTSIFLLIAETKTISSMLTKCSSQTL